MELRRYLKDNTLALKLLLISLSALYLIGAALPKHMDYWAILNMSTAFAVDPLHFMARVKVDYPPTFYALQGAWLNLGSYVFHYNLAISRDYVNSTLYSYNATRFGIFPFWGMIPILMALFALVGLSYRALRNKWLTLICFGPITFVSVFLMGQIDVFCALFIFISLILMQRALNGEKLFFTLVLAYLALGISMQFKTYGGLLLPAYLIYTVALFKGRGVAAEKSLLALLSCLAAFFVAVFMVWMPYPGWFNTVILHGESNWLLQRPSLIFQALRPARLSGVPIWLFGYVLILCYIAVRVLKNSEQSIRDKRYFIFYVFVIIAWFFAAVFTQPQWWMFLLPAALLSLDNFKKKRGIIFCLLILAVFPFYTLTFVTMPAFFAVYQVTAARITGNLAAFVSLVLTSALLFWAYELRKELRASEA